MSSSKPNLGILVSGQGSNMMAIIDAVREGLIGARVALVVADRKDVPALERARKAGVDTMHCPPDGLTRDGYDASLVKAFKSKGVEWVALAGFMRVVGKTLLSAFPGRMLNIHPGLLPAFRGLKAQRQALDAGVTVAGCTVHFVDEGVDTGAIIVQRTVPVLPGDTDESLSARILEQEHIAYPQALRLAISGAVRLEGRRVVPGQLRPPPVKRALISAWDKEGIPGLARALSRHGFALYATSGTVDTIAGAGLPVHDVSSLTGFGPLLGGRVKTLHPAVLAPVLARPTSAQDQSDMTAYGFEPFSVVVVNLYPFEKAAAAPDANPMEVQELVDIGGVTMVRAAAKNSDHVAVVCDPAEYGALIAALDEGRGEVTFERRRQMAARAFAWIARYDDAIARWSATCAGEALKQDAQGPSSGMKWPQIFSVSFSKVAELRYGENPHQQGAFFRDLGGASTGIASAKFIQGKELSFNNIVDADAALAVVRDFELPTVVIMKHANPCGLATAGSVAEAFLEAYDCDPISAYGGIIGINRPMTGAMAAAIVEKKLFLEVIIAPGYEPESLDRLAKRPNLRLVEVRPQDASGIERPSFDMRSVHGGMLVQTADRQLATAQQLRCVTEKCPPQEDLPDYLWAWIAAKHVKSNAIVLTRGSKTVGIGAGQMSRVDSVVIAGMKAGEKARGSIMASDAFLPFPDAVEEAAKLGVCGLIQPGGAKGDQAVVDAANKVGMFMLFTAERHFKH